MDLLPWYDTHARVLPWRGTRDLYEIWVSEIMLQQTRVQTVLQYFQPFLLDFPDVETLGGAPLQAVLKRWEGLGYYGRARNLHRAAGEVMAEHAGQVPRTPEGLTSLPGIGRSTAHSILSIGLDLPLPVLDGNVQRVLTRLRGIAADPRSREVDKELWNCATQWIERSQRPGDHNQALMDLGATVCTPRAPECARCPLGDSCIARRDGTWDRIPWKPGPKAIPHIHQAVAVVVAQGRILVQRRPEEGLLGGLWEFPGSVISDGETAGQAVLRTVREGLGLRVDSVEALSVVHHAYSHFKVTLHPYLCRWQQGEVRSQEGKPTSWEDLCGLSTLPLSVANLKVLQQIDRLYLEDGNVLANPDR
jgi:A/G-specific adenine glycosylase